MKLLERSVEELECTVNVLENKVTFHQILRTQCVEPREGKERKGRENIYFLFTFSPCIAKPIKGKNLLSDSPYHFLTVSFLFLLSSNRTLCRLCNTFQYTICPIYDTFFCFLRSTLSKGKWNGSG